MAGLHHVGNGQGAFHHFVAPILQKLDAAPPGHAGEHRARAGGGVDLPVDLEHDVHAAHFFDVLLLHAVQPQHLGEALLLRLLACLDGGGVVAAALGEARQARGRPDVLVLHVDADRVNALGIVRAGGGADDAERVLFAGVDAQPHVGGENEGTDVQGRAVDMGHPILIHFHQGLHRLDKVVHRDLRNAHPVGGILHPLGIALRAEELDGALRSAVGLHPLKQFLGVVKDHGGGVHLEGRVGDDAGVMPALSAGVVHQEHMVRENFGEAQLALVGGLGLGSGIFGDLDIQHGEHSPVFCIWGRAPAGRGISRVRFCTLNNYMLAAEQSQCFFSCLWNNGTGGGA